MNTTVKDLIIIKNKTMRGRNLTEYEKDLIFERWQDRIPTKVIAMELGVTYSCIYQQLKKRNLVG